MALHCLIQTNWGVGMLARLQRHRMLWPRPSPRTLAAVVVVVVAAAAATLTPGVRPTCTGLLVVMHWTA